MKLVRFVAIGTTRFGHISAPIAFCRQIVYTDSMKQVAMRDFQQKGGSVIDDKSHDPVLLSGRDGPKYFLVPAQIDGLELQFEELKRAQALANLRAWQLRARELGLVDISEKEIDEEIRESRKNRRKRRGK